MIDPDADVPVYRQIATELRTRIRSGELPARRALPSEAHLQQEFRVSRDSIRRAITLLTELGLVKTIPGRGTYVRSVDVTRVPVEPGMRIFSRPASKSEQATMELAAGAWVLVIERAGGEVEVLPAESAEISVTLSDEGPDS